MNNDTTRIRKQLGALLVRLLRENDFSALDRIPIDLRPKKNLQSRCCIYKDRAMLRYRLMALLGISIETEDNEYTSLADYALSAWKRTVSKHPVLTVSDVACSSCSGGIHRVSNLCMGCVARPCMNNCPVDAIAIENGRARIDSGKCINCGKCTDLCPYKAITYHPVPCEDKCPVKAISKNGAGQAVIDYDACIFCGRCTRSCPFGAVMERSALVDVLRTVQSTTESVALIAPSMVGQFPGTPGQLAAALRKIGFTYVEEVAEGAETTIDREAREFIALQNKGKHIMGTSCCPAYTEAVKKHIHEFIPNLSHTKSPLYYSGKSAHERYPEAVRVFIGPCVAKKAEALRDNSVEYVLTYEELGALFMGYGIELPDLEDTAFDSQQTTYHARGFAASGGVSRAVAHRVSQISDIPLHPLHINGLDTKGLQKLRVAGKGKCTQNLVEVMSCEGGCLYGPGIICNPRISEKKLKEYMEESTPERTTS
jgi:[FeFe] hydrogenase (group B1/B3)